jgi:hypothetical protein
MNPTPTPVKIQVLLLVLDAEEVISNGKDMADVETLEDCLYELANNPSEFASDCGYEVIAGSTVTQIQGDEYLLTLNAIVRSQSKLKKAAREAYEDCWGGGKITDAYDQPSLEDFLYEVAVASNASPSPAECGYSIVRRV